MAEQTACPNSTEDRYAAIVATIGGERPSLIGIFGRTAIAGAIAVVRPVRLASLVRLASTGTTAFQWIS